MIQSEIIALLQGIIKAEKQWEYYEHTTEIAEKCEALTTGHGIDKYLHQFVRREDKEQFNQRKLLTTHIVPSLVGSLNAITKKAMRSPAVTREYFNESTDKLKKLKESDNQYYAKSNVKQYLDDFGEIYQSIDPNAYIITEFMSTDGTKLAKPYPFIAWSENIYFVNYNNGFLNYIVVTDADEDIKEFTIYTENQNIKFTLTNKNFFCQEMEVKDIDGVFITLINNKYYIITTPEPHNIGFVPAKIIGYVKDGETEGETMLPFWWGAYPYLRKLIKTVSEMDLSECLHAFPQKLIYTRRCNALGCIAGYSADGVICPVCKGTGKQIIHTTASDVIEFPLPDTKEEMIDLAQMILYVYPPIDGLKFQDERIDKLIKQAKEAVFNSDTYTRKEISTTATGQNIGIQAVYDVVYPYAVNAVNLWAFVIETISLITDTNEGLIINASVQRDFKFKTKEELISELQAAKTAGANETVIRLLNDEIIFAMYSEQPYELKKYTIKDFFNPFSGKQPEEIIALMTSALIPKEIKVLYANFSNIFDEIEVENADFYEFEINKQREIVVKKINEYVKKVDVTPPQFTLNA